MEQLKNKFMGKKVATKEEREDDERREVQHYHSAQLSNHVRRAQLPIALTYSCFHRNAWRST